MALGKTGKRLELVRDRLVSARQQAGESAATLQRDISGMLTEIEDMLHQWFPDRSRVDDICSQAEALIRSAPEMRKLSIEISRVSGELQAARAELEKLDDSDISICGCRRIDQWDQQVKRAGEVAASSRQSFFAGTDPEIERISVIAKRQSEAARKVIEAAALIHRVGKGPKTAPLEIELGNFRELFQRQEPSPESIENLERAMSPIRVIANTPPPPPPPPPASLRELRLLMPQARRWLDALGSDRSPLVALEDRMTQAEVVPGGTSGTDSLRDDVREFVAQLHQKARLERDDKFHKLNADFGYYEEACGTERQMASVIQALNELNIEQTDSASFEIWREQFGKAQSHFDGLAKAGAAMLESLCRKKIEACAARLSELRGRNLLDEVRRECDGARARLEQLGTPKGPVAALANLHAVGKLEDEVEKLDRRSADDLESYSKSRDVATVRKRELEGLAQEVGLPLLPMRALDASPQMSLGRCREILDGFLVDLDAASEGFLRACHAASVSDHAFCEAAATVLKSIASASLPLFPCVPARPDGPPVAAAQRSEYAAIRSQFAEILEQQARELTAKLSEIRNALKDWSGDRTDDLQEARSLVDDIDSGGYDSEPELMERVRGLIEIRARCDNFFHRMERDRREAEEKMQRIRQRWRRFTERDLKVYYPEYATRITGLLMGVPPTPSDWKAVSRQMDEIAAILGPIEKDGLRKAAVEIEDAFRILSKRLPESSPEKKREIQLLLDSLRGSVEFPDSATRRKLLTLREGGVR